MQIIEITKDYEVFQDYFQGNPVRFMKDRKTGEININADDAAKCMGYDSLTDMMLKNEVVCNIALDAFRKGQIKRI